MSSPIKNIYNGMLKHSGSLEAVRGSILGMLQMYKQDKLPVEEIKEIEEILKDIEQKIKDEESQNSNGIN
jgi:hypothetical protein